MHGTPEGPISIDQTPVGWVQGIESLLDGMRNAITFGGGGGWEWSMQVLRIVGPFAGSKFEEVLLSKLQ